LRLGLASTAGRVDTRAHLKKRTFTIIMENYIKIMKETDKLLALPENNISGT
jgi:hypothetical protein